MISSLLILKRLHKYPFDTLTVAWDAIIDNYHRLFFMSEERYSAPYKNIALVLQWLVVGLVAIPALTIASLLIAPYYLIKLISFLETSMVNLLTQDKLNDVISDYQISNGAKAYQEAYNSFIQIERHLILYQGEKTLQLLQEGPCLQISDEEIKQRYLQTNYSGHTYEGSEYELQNQAFNNEVYSTMLPSIGFIHIYHVNKALVLNLFMATNDEPILFKPAAAVASLLLSLLAFFIVLILLFILAAYLLLFTSSVSTVGAALCLINMPLLINDEIIQFKKGQSDPSKAIIRQSNSFFEITEKDITKETQITSCVLPSKDNIGATCSAQN